MKINDKRDLSLDFIKGFAILFVIFEHTALDAFDSFLKILPIQAVPIFLTISFYLNFKKIGEDYNVCSIWFSRQRITRMVKRIIVPYLLFLVFNLVITYNYEPNVQLWKVAITGGNGPGSYFLWVYLQLWILTPFLFILLDRNRYFKGILYLLFICIVLNSICSYLQINKIFYRLICVRYVFVAAIAYMWLNIDKFNKWWVLLLGCGSYLYLINYRFDDLEPFVYNGGWSIQNYPAYFFTLIIILVLKVLFKEIVRKATTAVRLFNWCGEQSWSLFLLQMNIIYICILLGIDHKLNDYCILYATGVALACVCGTYLINIINSLHD